MTAPNAQTAKQKQINMASKYQEITTILEDRVRTGEWESTRFPSVRSLASEFGVSVVTASRAVHQLREKGLLRTVERGGSYTVASEPAPVSWILCQHKTPGQWQRATEAITISGFESMARKLGDRIELNAFDLSGSEPEPYVRVLREAITTGVRGLFLLPSRVSEEACARDEALLEACRRVGLPIVLIERNLRGDGRRLEHDLISSDDFTGGVELTRHLLGMGRSRIAFVTGSPIDSHIARMAGYLYAWQASGSSEPPVILQQDTTLSHRSAYKSLVEQLLDTGADSVICYQDYTAFGLMMELMHRGIRVPGQMSLAGFDDVAFGETFAIGMTTYALPAAEMAREALARMRHRVENPELNPVKITVPGRIIIRESSNPES